jgi:hypothetical protein
MTGGGCWAIEVLDKFVRTEWREMHIKPGWDLGMILCYPGPLFSGLLNDNCNHHTLSDRFTRTSQKPPPRAGIYYTLGVGEVIVSDCPALDAFNVSAARYRGVRIAAGNGVETAVVADADVIPEPAVVKQVIAQSSDRQLHLPYDRWRMLTSDGTSDFIAGKHWEDCAVDLDWTESIGGIFIMNVQSWIALGGNDVGFKTWGCEDDAFILAAKALVGVTRHRGIAHHLWHPGDHYRVMHGPQWEHNMSLLDAYETASTNPDSMAALIRERQRN